MKALKAILARICAAESSIEDLEADRGAALDRETALGCLAFGCLSAAERELLHAAFARDAPVGEAETAAVGRFDVLSARFASCTTTKQAHELWYEFNAPYYGYEPSILRVFAALDAELFARKITDEKMMPSNARRNG